MLGDKSWRVYDENFRMLSESSDLPRPKAAEELRVKASVMCSFQSQQPFRTKLMQAADLLNYVMPSTMMNLVHTTPALTATSVSYVQCHMQKSTVECEDKNKVQSIQPNPHITPTVCQLPSPINP